jgi:CheY-like chemotaxis protein
MHGGRLEAHSDGDGTGSTFIFRIGLVGSESVVVEELEQKSHSLKGLKVLLVEDSEDTLTLLSAVFAREGARVISATSAADALRWASTNQPDVVISDIGMPDVDGYELLEQLRQMPKMNGIPAIAISGYASDEDRRKAISVGYLALVAKPIDVDALFALIHDFKIPAAQP